MPSLARSVPKPLKVPSLARSVSKPLKMPSLARSVPKPLMGGSRRAPALRYELLPMFAIGLLPSWSSIARYSFLSTEGIELEIGKRATKKEKGKKIN